MWIISACAKNAETEAARTAGDVVTGGVSSVDGSDEGDSSGFVADFFFFLDAEGIVGVEGRALGDSKRGAGGL